EEAPRRAGARRQRRRQRRAHAEAAQAGRRRGRSSCGARGPRDRGRGGRAGAGPGAGRHPRRHRRAERRHPGVRRRLALEVQAGAGGLQEVRGFLPRAGADRRRRGRRQLPGDEGGRGAPAGLPRRQGHADLAEARGGRLAGVLPGDAPGRAGAGSALRRAPAGRAAEKMNSKQSRAEASGDAACLAALTAAAQNSGFPAAKACALQAPAPAGAGEVAASGGAAATEAGRRKKTARASRGRRSRRTCRRQ
ncbi:unnamed protein product, partial [Prorocentrum cordatum]